MRFFPVYLLAWKKQQTPVSLYPHICTRKTTPPRIATAISASPVCNVVSRDPSGFCHRSHPSHFTLSFLPVHLFHARANLFSPSQWVISFQAPERFY